jgi:threonine dehydrogenase-like Zn-dependent dehydrogenase
MDVAVVGSGTLGLIAVQLLKLASPARLVMVGSRPSRLQVAKELGADLAVEASDAFAVAQIEGQFDLVFEAASRPEGTSTALRLARRGGTVVLEGIYEAGSSLPADSIIALKHLSVQGVFGASRRAWQWILHLFGLGSLDLRALVTHRLPLEEVGAAFAVLGDRTSNVIKVQMTP